MEIFIYCFVLLFLIGQKIQQSLGSRKNSDNLYPSKIISLVLLYFQSLVLLLLCLWPPSYLMKMRYHELIICCAKWGSEDQRAFQLILHCNDQQQESALYNSEREDIKLAIIPMFLPPVLELSCFWVDYTAYIF